MYGGLMFELEWECGNKLLSIVRYVHAKAILFCFSGGKDSLVSTHLGWNWTNKSKVFRKVIHVDTTVSLPKVQDYVKKVAKLYGWDLKILKPSKSFWELAEKKGMPTLNRRWCCEWLKLKPMFEYACSLKKPVVLFVLGLRRSESVRRSKMPDLWKRKYRGWLFFNYSPIMDWNNEDIKSYIGHYGLRINPLYDIIGHSGECICGVYASFKELQVIRANFPEFLEKFKKLEDAWKRSKKWKNTKYTFYVNNKRLKVDDLLKQLLLEIG